MSKCIMTAIQVMEKGKWRSVCTNSRNWTMADLGVACGQLGFTGGEWHHWYEHLNHTKQILYQDPGKAPSHPLYPTQRHQSAKAPIDRH